MKTTAEMTGIICSNAACAAAADASPKWKLVRQQIWDAWFDAIKKACEL